MNLYFAWCHKQPIVLFESAAALRRICQMSEPSFVLSLQSLSLRFPPPETTNQRYLLDLDNMAATARHQIMSRLGNNRVEISYIQALCLLSIVGFNSGKFVQAGLDLAVASQLVDSLDTVSGSTDPAQLLYCKRAITMLQNLQGAAPTLVFPDRFLDSDRANSEWWNSSSASVMPVGTDPYQEGLLKATSDLAQVWRMARAYVIHRPKADEPPPWLIQSDFSKVMTGHLKFDSTIPKEFRYGASRLFDQDPSSLQRQRHYWMPWLTVQMMFSVIPCLLYHPFLLSIRLKHYRDMMPHSFIQQSWEQITRQAGWIMHFLELLETSALVITDPALAHCAVIIATIHLQHSFVQDQELQARSREGFEKCLRFVHRSSRAWPIVAAMVSVLRLGYVEQYPS